MGYDLYARNKKHPLGERFRMGAFSWGWMLYEGVGLPLGLGRSTDPATYRFRPDAKGRDPMCNNGFRVTADQAKAMAFCAQGLVSVQRGIQSEWDGFSEAERQRRIDSRWKDMYRQPVREDFIEKAEAFAVWAEQSQGFSIY